MTADCLVPQANDADPGANIMQQRLTLRRLGSFFHRHSVLFCILAIGIAVRAFRFGEIPPGLHLDEASTSYDAWALLHYGIDRNGFRFPMALVAWGGGNMSALPAYLAIPFLWLLGPTVTAVRLPSLMLNLLALGTFYVLCRRLCGERVALIAVFLLVISPWHVLASRWGHEFNLLPPWILFGSTAFAMVDGTRQWPFLLGCAFVASSVYVYPPALFFAPLFLVGCTLLLYHFQEIRRRAVFGGALLCVGIVMPMVLFLAINHLHLHSIDLPVLSIPRLPGPPRFAALGIFFGGHTLHDLLSNAHRLLSILASQSDGLPWNAVPGFGVVYAWGMVLALLGLLLLPMLRQKHDWSMRVGIMVIWLAIALLLGVVVSPNINRINLLYLPVVFFIALALHAIPLRPLLWGAIGVCLLSFAAFIRVYFTTYTQALAPRFYASLGSAINDAATRTQGRICVTTQPYRPYIYVLYYQQIDPHVFLKTVQYVNPTAEFRQVRSFGRFFFGIEDCRRLPDISAYVVERGREPEVRGYLVHRHEFYTVAVRPLREPRK
jgi:Dolichyl-phosphate-mannose-protein mannosyltransferase